MVKISLLRKKQKKQKGYLKGEVGQAKRGTGDGMMRYQGIQDRAFTYSSRLAWIDSILFFSSTSLSSSFIMSSWEICSFFSFSAISKPLFVYSVCYNSACNFRELSCGQFYHRERQIATTTAIFAVCALRSPALPVIKKLHLARCVVVAVLALGRSHPILLILLPIRKNNTAQMGGVILWSRVRESICIRGCFRGWIDSKILESIRS